MLWLYGDVAAMNAPPLKLKENAPVPPLNVAVMLPVAQPKQVASTLDNMSVIAAGCETVTELLARQPLASFTAIEYVAATKPPKTFEAWNVRPPSLEYV